MDSSGGHGTSLCNDINSLVRDGLLDDGLPRSSRLLLYLTISNGLTVSKAFEVKASSANMEISEGEDVSYVEAEILDLVNAPIWNLEDGLTITKTFHLKTYNKPHVRTQTPSF